MVLGEMDVARVSPYRPVDVHCTWPVTHPTDQLRSPNPGGGGATRGLPLTRRTTTFGEDRKRYQLRAESESQSFMAVTPMRPAQLTAFYVNPLPRRNRKRLHSQISRGC